jgi:death on curing protein
VEYLRVEEVIDFHDFLIEKYGGLSGIRDLGLLNLAMAMPQQSFMGEELHQTIYEKAAAYLYHLVMNHPFFDENKRIPIVNKNLGFWL